MTEPMSGDSAADERFVRLDDGDMHVVADGKPAAPALLLIHGTGASTAWWDPVVPRLAGAYRGIRVHPLRHGRASSPARGGRNPSPGPPGRAPPGPAWGGRGAADRGLPSRLRGPRPVPAPGR